jgi:hypothetical protein
MATKNPIENYLKGEELDNQPYFSKGISRRGFLKLAGGTALGAVFGEGFLKQMEAWAQDGVSVYIDNFLIGGDIPEGKYQNVDKTIPRELAKILKNKGIKVLTNPDRITDDTIIIRGTFTYIADDHSMPRISDGSPFFADSIKISVEYENGGSLMGSKELKYDWRFYPDPMLENVGREVAAELKGTRGNNRITKNNPDEVSIDIGGEYETINKSRLRRAVLPQRTLEGINSSDPKVRAYWKEWQKKENIGFGPDGQCYFIVR